MVLLAGCPVLHWCWCCAEKGGQGPRAKKPGERGGEGRGDWFPYGVVDDILSSRVVVNIDGHAAQGRHLGRQLIEARVVLALALVCFGHSGGFI